MSKQIVPLDAYFLLRRKTKITSTF